MPDRTFTGKASELSLIEEGDLVRNRQRAGHRNRTVFTLMVILALLVVGCWRF